MDLVLQNYFHRNERSGSKSTNKKLVKFLKKKGAYGRFLTYTQFFNAQGTCMFNFRWGRTKEGYTFWKKLYVEWTNELYNRTPSDVRVHRETRLMQFVPLTED